MELCSRLIIYTVFSWLRYPILMSCISWEYSYFWKDLWRLVIWLIQSSFKLFGYNETLRKRVERNLSGLNIFTLFRLISLKLNNLYRFKLYNWKQRTYTQEIGVQENIVNMLIEILLSIYGLRYASFIITIWIGLLIRLKIWL